MLDDIAGLPPATVPAAQPGAFNTRSLAARAPQSVAAAPSGPTPPSSRTTGSLPHKTFWLGGGAVVAVFVLSRIDRRRRPIGLHHRRRPDETRGGLARRRQPLHRRQPFQQPFRGRPRTPRPPATPSVRPARSCSRTTSTTARAAGAGLHSNLSSADYQDEVYRIRFDGTNDDAWATSGHDFDDVRVHGLRCKVGGPDDNDFGVICRYSDDGKLLRFPHYQRRLLWDHEDEGWRADHGRTRRRQLPGVRPPSIKALRRTRLWPRVSTTIWPCM